MIGQEVFAWWWVWDGGTNVSELIGGSQRSKRRIPPGGAGSTVPCYLRWWKLLHRGSEGKPLRCLQGARWPLDRLWLVSQGSRVALGDVSLMREEGSHPPTSATTG